MLNSSTVLVVLDTSLSCLLPFAKIVKFWTGFSLTFSVAKSSATNCLLISLNFGFALIFAAFSS
ncbi:MAG: hypothetical protein LF884_02565 [Rickettsia endosymbiont of Cimex lectularius]|uniref:hypothetical protein n=1 Tax=Candidatus Tisiphia endosymbiont of Psammoecus bipunctatus TaxID=3139333 RepID=UPI001E7EE89C|nr:MAG: hypothetical protein LF884_02565 [Rickettsia endosymbiont of Cimex lectularius]